MTKLFSTFEDMIRDVIREAKEQSSLAADQLLIIINPEDAKEENMTIHQDDSGQPFCLVDGMRVRVDTSVPLGVIGACEPDKLDRMLEEMKSGNIAQMVADVTAELEDSLDDEGMSPNDSRFDDVFELPNLNKQSKMLH